MYSFNEALSDPFLTGSRACIGVRSNRGGPSWLLSLSPLDAPEALPSGSTMSPELALVWREDFDVDMFPDVPF